MQRRHPINDYLATADASATLIDVREPAELATGTLPGAVNIPLGTLAARLGESMRGRRAVVFCRSGGRSAQAAQTLAAAGFADVVDLEGGMLAFDGDVQLPERTTS